MYKVKATYDFTSLSTTDTWVSNYCGFIPTDVDHLLRGRPAATGLSLKSELLAAVDVICHRS